MKYNLELLKADILDEIEKVVRLENEFSKVKKRVDLTSQQMSYYDRGAIGYLLHNFYNGCENIFRSIARFFENDLGPESWHRDLLKRMKVRVEGYRPPVIDPELYYLLDDCRAFRHKFRHSYGFELDWEKESLLVNKFEYTVKLFKIQIQSFIKELDKIEDE
jgi:hypothetical protein